MVLGDFYISHYIHIQLGEYSTSSGLEGAVHTNWILQVNGNRLIAGNFDENGLNCNNWNENGNDNVGFFLLMVL